MRSQEHEQYQRQQADHLIIQISFDLIHSVYTLLIHHLVDSKTAQNVILFRGNVIKCTFLQKKWG